MSAVKEQALLLGPRKSLVAVLAPAQATQARPDAPTIVIVNAGIIHRVGPNRLHVLLARRLAEAGYNVLRFDLSGIGDSAPREDALPPFEAALADIREVIDALEVTRNVRQVSLIGLCSGADQALLYASRDPRVVAIGLLDPSIPRTRGYFLRHWARRLLKLQTWGNALSGRYALWRRVSTRVASVAPVEQAGAAPQLSLESAEVRAALGEAYQTVTRQKTRLLAVFAGTAGREYRLNYREQMLDAFPGVDFGDLLQLEYFKDADHTFSGERDRTALIDLVVRWMTSLTVPGSRLQQLVSGVVLVSLLATGVDA